VDFDFLSYVTPEMWIAAGYIVGAFILGGTVLACMYFGFRWFNGWMQ
jgi:hypothetical protein